MKYLLVTLAFAINLTGVAQSGSYTFPASQVSSTSIYPVVYNGPTVANLNFSNLTITGLSYSNSNNNAMATAFSLGATHGNGTFTGTIDLSKYFEITLTPTSGNYIHNPKVDFGIRRSSTGPRQFEWRSSIDNFGSAITVGTLSTSLTQTSGVITVPDASSTTTWAGNSMTIPQVGLTSITYRFYCYNAEGPTGTGGFGGTLTITATVNTLLPVSFTSFSATKDGKNNLLSWATASEQNNAGFEVQRSTDGSTYENIGFVKSLSATGNSSNPLSYSFTDFNPLGLQQYYRLKQTDLDGKSAYSAIVLVKREAPATLTVTKVYPNPSTSSIYINAACPAATTLQLSIVDMSGRVVGRKQVNAMTGNNGFDMPVTQLAPGTYLLQVLNADNKVVTTEKFIKQ
jgi:hypothetical protein